MLDSDVSMYKAYFVPVESYEVIKKKWALTDNDVTMDNYRALKRLKSANI